MCRTLYLNFPTSLQYENFIFSNYFFFAPWEIESLMCEYDDVIYIYKYNFCENSYDMVLKIN